MVDGDIETTSQWYWNGSNGEEGDWVKFDLGSNKVIDEAKYYQSHTTTHAMVKWQGSTNDSAWTDIGVAFRLGGSALDPPQTITTLNGNTTAYRYYRLLIDDTSTGEMSSAPWCMEFEFKVEA